MSDKPPEYYSDTDTIALPFIFIPDGQRLPDAIRHFRDPIILRARFEPEPAAPVPPQPTVRTILGYAAPIHAPLRQQSERPAIRNLSQDASSGNRMIAYNQCVSECADLYEDGLLSGPKGIGGSNVLSFDKIVHTCLPEPHGL